MFFFIDAFHLLIEGKRKHTPPTARSSGLYSGPGLNCSCYHLDLVSHSNRCALYNALFFLQVWLSDSQYHLEKELEVPPRLKLIALEYATLRGWSSWCLAFSRGWVFFFFFFFLKASLPRLTDCNCQRRENAEHPCLMPDEKGHSSSSVLHWVTSTLNNDGGHGGWRLSSPPFSTPFLPAKKQKV